MLMASTSPSKHEPNAGDASGPLAKFRNFLNDGVRPARPLRSPSPPTSRWQANERWLMGYKYFCLDGSAVLAESEVMAIALTSGPLPFCRQEPRIRETCRAL